MSSDPGTSNSNGYSEWLSRNPLLTALPREMKRQEIEAWLDGGRRRRVMSPSDVKGWIEDGFAITPVAISIARVMLKMMRRSAQDQDPRLMDNRRRSFDEQVYVGLRALSASGVCLSGVTAVGKSHIIQHVLQRIPQVVDHGPDAESQMLGLLQLVHLTIQMSGDGTPTAFFQNAIHALDQVLGTDYSSSAEARGRGSRNSAMTYFVRLLKKHRLLLLVVEEGQLKNLGNKKFRKVLDGLVIQLMNYGIPIVVLGNPLGINELKRESQAQRRLCSNGDYRIDPALTWKERLWGGLYVECIWSPTPLSEPDEVWGTSDELNRLLWQATGGFPGLLAHLREVTLCNALERDGSRVNKVDLLTALASADYAGSRAIAEPFVTRNAALLEQRFDDAQPAYYAELWEHLRRSEQSGNASSATPDSRALDSISPEVNETNAPVVKATPVRRGRGMQREKKCRETLNTESGASKECVPLDDARSEDWIAQQPMSIDVCRPTS